METTDKILGGSIIIIAGVFQFTPLKKRCLHYCRTPVDFVHRNWKEGKTGAIKMGIENGIFCLGCCWVLMTLLFVAGIMNLLWIALITLFILVEKMIPYSKPVSFIAGALLVVYGISLLLR
jgi:predicted metal-binding membrane protein